MSVDVTTTIWIRRPRAQVARFAADPANAPAWYENINSIEWVGEPGIRVSARAAFVARFLGRRLAYTYAITEFVPDEKLVMRTSEGPFPMETAYTWRDEGDGTRMTLSNRGEPSGFSRLVAPVMAGAMRRANVRDLDRLKGLLEGEPLDR